MTDNSTQSNLQERNQQALNSISQLQTQEKELYTSLDDPGLTSEQKQQIINKINEISQMRLNIYSGMQDIYSYYQQNVSSSRNTLGQEVSAIDIIENELNQAKKKLNLIQDEKSNKLRLVEINTYYGKRYNAHTQLMKTIVLTCIPIIILSILANKGILPPKLYRVLAAIVLIIGVVILGRQLIDMSNRSNMNWDEYEWYFDPSKAPTATSDTSSQNPWATGAITCIGSACCYEGSTYDEMKNMCVPNDVYAQDYPDTTTTTSTTDMTTESFISGKVLGKYGGAQVKATPYNNVIMPTYASLSNF
jgi:hypothetical protein